MITTPQTVLGTLLLLTLLSPCQTTSAAPQKPWPRHTIDDSSIGADGVRLADVNHDGHPDIVTGWEEGGQVRLYLNPGPAHSKQKWPAVTVGNAKSVEDAVLADLDGDQAPDVISACEGSRKSLLVHWAPVKKQAFLDASAWQTGPIPVTDGLTRWMFSVPTQVDGKHGIDIIAGSKNPNGQIGWLQAPTHPRRLEDWIWHSLRPAGWIMSLMSVDMDNDGDLDLLFSDRKGARSGCFWLEHPAANLSQPWPEHPVGALGKEAMFLTRVDLDQDGNQDVLAAVRPHQIFFFRALNAKGTRWSSRRIPVPESAGGAKAVAVGDINKDGTLDIVFTCEHARDKSGVMWLSPEGSVTTGDWTAHDISGEEGIKYDLVELIDLDHDGDLDVLTCEERQRLGVIWYENPALSQ